MSNLLQYELFFCLSNVGSSLFHHSIQFSYLDSTVTAEPWLGAPFPPADESCEATYPAFYLKESWD